MGLKNQRKVEKKYTSRKKKKKKEIENSEPKPNERKPKSYSHCFIISNMT